MQRWVGRGQSCIICQSGLDGITTLSLQIYAKKKTKLKKHNTIELIAKYQKDKSQYITGFFNYKTIYKKTNTQ
jgi:hypothetical protein